MAFSSRVTHLAQVGLLVRVVAAVVVSVTDVPEPRTPVARAAVDLVVLRAGGVGCGWKRRRGDRRIGGTSFTVCTRTLRKTESQREAAEDEVTDKRIV